MRKGWRASWIAGALLAGLCAGSALAEAAPELPVENFAHLPVMADVDMSPDGSHVAFLAPVNGRQHLVVRKLPLTPGEKPAVIGPSDAEIVGFDWISNERLLVRILTTEKMNTSDGRKPLRFTRTVSMSRDLKDMKVLLSRAPDNGYFLQHTPILQFIDDENVLAAYPTEDGPWPGVVKLNVISGSFTRVRRPVRNVIAFIPDPTGEIRIAETYNDRALESRYLRRVAGGDFELMMKNKVMEDDGGFGILGFDASGQNLFVVSRHEGDLSAIYRYDLASDQMGEKVASDPRFDVSSAVVQRGAVVAFAWLDDLPRRQWVDPAVQKLQDALDKAVPDSREIVMDVADGGNLVLVASYSLSAPTTYRLFNRRTKEFSIFGDTYPGIPQESVSPRKPVTYKATDGTDIPGYLVLPVGVEGKNLPFIIMPHGGPFSRDDGTFDVMAQFLANRGYGVLQPNFRGSTGYGYAFNQAGERQWGGLMQDDVTDAAKWAVAQGYADPNRMCILGWSYGGYAALMAAVKTPDLFKCAVATAPVANLERLYDEVKSSGFGNITRGLYFGDNSDALKPISPYHQADKIKVPVLLVHGDLDYQASVAHGRDMRRALERAGKQVEYVEIKGMDHAPLVTEHMKIVMQAWEKFLKTHLGK
ncbi:S9 family peptidase [Niveispirillum sp.]|uniref:alpha/beta hydrolase family protein n=1 Tax=Niveispirillum sp. TaxID=1917217 RepID=UPI001B466095|nr:S9 family peptidase [Niveispirillum sp.]MBP7335396.1 S9 family peptidase [Niveispirillum sp.]